jgi:SAM-dependent methyltransferase
MTAATVRCQINIRPLLKRLVPGPLRPHLRRCLRLLRPDAAYQARIQSEFEAFTDENVSDLPPILTYWAEKHIAPIFTPFGFVNSIECIRTYLARVCRTTPETCAFVSIGAGSCATEINIAEWLRERAIHNYTIECVDVNPVLLQRAAVLAQEKGLSHHFEFSALDVNKWRPARRYDAIVALQSLHHVVKLEALFDAIYGALKPDGYFLTDDMIGRNGHQRWPEALKFVYEFWRELPDKYKYNRKLNRLEKDYDDFDCSTEGFEGIRAQDVLPLLVDRFHFELFLAFGNVVDIFVDRCFGPNFDPENEWDRAFIDRVHELDAAEIDSGRLKPTHILAAMKKTPVARTLMYKHLSPEFCIRHYRNR